jgi:hypothetical protein
MTAQVWHVPGRQVEAIVLDGHPAFWVYDPRHAVQAADGHGYVRIITRVRDGKVIFAQPTVTGLARLGVGIAAMRPGPLSLDAPAAPAAPVTGRPGESAAELNLRRYQTRLGEVLDDLAARKQHQEAA